MTQSVWKNRDFLWLFSGRTISQFGTAITVFTIPWLLLQLTGQQRKRDWLLLSALFPIYFYLCRQTFGLTNITAKR